MKMKANFSIAIAIIVLAIGISFLIGGIQRQEPWRVYSNARILCLSCIGLGD